MCALRNGHVTAAVCVPVARGEHLQQLLQQHSLPPPPSLPLHLLNVALQSTTRRVRISVMQAQQGQEGVGEVALQGVQ